jgi:hypothetical protein
MQIFRLFQGFLNPELVAFKAHFVLTTSALGIFILFLISPSFLVWVFLVLFSFSFYLWLSFFLVSLVISSLRFVKMISIIVEPTLNPAITTGHNDLSEIFQCMGRAP